MNPEFASDWVYPELPDGVQGFTTTRSGGASRGSFQGFNLAAHVGDVAAAVTRNRSALAGAMDCRQVQWLQQVHGTACVRASASTARSVPEADASWTDEGALALAVLTADCLPVVFAARDASVVAVAHAGWRGLVGGVLQAIVGKLPVESRALVAWIGPAIGFARYEVGQEVRAAAMAGYADAGAFFRVAREGKYIFDLAGMAAEQLERIGVSEVRCSGICCASDSRFYSYRRDGVTGRMATVVWRSG